MSAIKGFFNKRECNNYEHSDKNEKHTIQHGDFKIDESNINIDACKKHCPNLIKSCYDRLTSNDWKLERISSDGDVVSYMKLPETQRKIFKVTGIIDAPAEELLNYIFDHIESIPTWNNHVEESKRICMIDEKSDVIYQAAKSYGHGLIGARDFILMRHQGKFDDYFIIGNISADLEDEPKRKNYIRGKNGISCIATRNVMDCDEDKCYFTWMMDLTLNGWIPEKLIEMCTAIGFINFMGYLRIHARKLRKELWNKHY